MNVKDLLTVKESAEYLGVREQTIRDYISSGRLESKKVFNTRVVAIEELDRYLEYIKSLK